MSSSLLHDGTQRDQVLGRFSTEHSRWRWPCHALRATFYDGAEVSPAALRLAVPPFSTPAALASTS